MDTIRITITRQGQHDVGIVQQFEPGTRPDTPWIEEIIRRAARDAVGQAYGRPHGRNTLYQRFRDQFTPQAQAEQTFAEVFEALRTTRGTWNHVDPLAQRPRRRSSHDHWVRDAES